MTEVITPPDTMLASDIAVQAVPEVEQTAPHRSAVPPIPDAMLEAVPANTAFRQAYLVGALAATQRRAHPIVAPREWDIPPRHQAQPDADGYFEPLTAGEMPYLTSPLVEFVRQEMPDLVMAADRGGRVLGLAVHGIWQQRYPGAPFPTIDSKVHFGRVSTGYGAAVIGPLVSGVLHRSGVMAEMAQRKAEGDERPLTVMLLDDWIGWGATAAMVRQILEEQGLVMGQNLRFLLGTMMGSLINNGTVDQHVVGHMGRRGGAIWNDNGGYIGLDYQVVHTYNDEDSTYPAGRMVCESVKSRAAQGLRQELWRAVQRDIVPSPYPYPRAFAGHMGRPKPKGGDNGFSESV